MNLAIPLPAPKARARLAKLDSRWKQHWRRPTLNFALIWDDHVRGLRVYTYDHARQPFRKSLLDWTWARH